MTRVETSQGSTRSWFNCDTGVFVSKRTSSDLRVERTEPVPKLAGWIPPNEVVQLVVDDQVPGTAKVDAKHSGQMSRRFVPKHEFSLRNQRNPFGPKAAKTVPLVYAISSGRRDSNPGPPGPKPGALTKLRYAPCPPSLHIR
jgi:hypothetical protein